VAHAHAASLDREADVEELRTSYTSLTPREREVMKLIVSGMLNKQVGLHLGISEITVKAHRGKMMQKMKADSLADLVKITVRVQCIGSDVSVVAYAILPLVQKRMSVRKPSCNSSFSSSFVLGWTNQPILCKALR
jgi:DNA-binding NarL/FixJ family response regulator